MRGDGRRQESKNAFADNYHNTQSPLHLAPLRLPRQQFRRRRQSEHHFHQSVQQQQGNQVAPAAEAFAVAVTLRTNAVFPSVYTTRSVGNAVANCIFSDS